MGMVVQHNMNAINSYNKLNANVAGMKKSSEKLSSGYRINRAGDDAAGLAVSEKMRSQIKGLNQAIRNSQDGINMIQTFEGAAQETHSILQRMKELATQSANGTYDNATDRAAIQLEFDQLNDELNQIADTDFNGTVVLNGGQMADGAVANKAGIIDYANQPARGAEQWGVSDINSIDSKGYNGDMKSANALWDNLGLSKDVESVDLTFKYNESSDTWSISDSNNSTALANKANIVIVRGGADADLSATANTPSNNNGGFSIMNSATTVATGKLSTVASGAKTIEYANVVLDSSKLVDGDTVTLTFTRPNITNTAPENIGVADGTFKTEFASGVTIANPTMTVNGGGTAATNFETTNNGTPAVKMTEEAAKAFNGLNGAKFDITYNNTAVDASSVSAIKVTLADGTDKNLTLDATGQAITDDSGNKYKFDVTAAGVITIKDDGGHELAKITPGAATAAAATVGDKSKVSFELALDEAIYSEAAKPNVSVANPATDGAVSKSNSFKNSTAIMTYADNITLQTGARTKDSVNFTFNYNTDKTADMGDLKANLNLSARADGLNTANLSLATQEDANKAIDQIDKAINKTSMVRASFGSIQNRLEHKITNLTTTSENLTEAESSIRDTDMASEMMNYTKFNILQQAAQSMLAQANQQPQSILQLLG